MKRIPFTKYTSCGNHFVLLDGTQGDLLSEPEVSAFACKATNPAFGIGCDNLLMIQRCDHKTLANIAAEHSYWDGIPDPAQAEFIFRMFEPSGEEALCCGNGLLCIADYLYAHYGVAQTSVMTEIPLSRPCIRSIGHRSSGNGSWANMGHPRRIPPPLLQPGGTLYHSAAIDQTGELTVPFQSRELAPYSNTHSLTLSGYLVFTGEPHLVVFPERGFSRPELVAPLFDIKVGKEMDLSHHGHQPSFGSWLVHRISAYINHQYQDRFPAGININFARLSGAERVENRCFERGINRETLACGTGALAVAYISQHLHAGQSAASANRPVDILPHRCRWQDPEARIQVQGTKDGWLLSSKPTLLFEGVYRLEPAFAPVLAEMPYRQAIPTGHAV